MLGIDYHQSLSHKSSKTLTQADILSDYDNPVLLSSKIHNCKLLEPQILLVCIVTHSFDLSSNGGLNRTPFSSETFGFKISITPRSEPAKALILAASA